MAAGASAGRAHLRFFLTSRLKQSAKSLELRQRPCASLIYFSTKLRNRTSCLGFCYTVSHTKTFLSLFLESTNSLVGNVKKVFVFLLFSLPQK